MEHTVEQTITAIEMRRKFGETLDRVAKNGEHITITRGNLHMATLIPAREHEAQCTKEGRVKKVENFFRAVKTWQERNKEALEKMRGVDSVEEIRKMRASRWSSSTPR